MRRTHTHVIFVANMRAGNEQLLHYRLVPFSRSDGEWRIRLRVYSIGICACS
jgi:hypothetical protein